jgi:hypothetical protein
VSPFILGAIASSIRLPTIKSVDFLVYGGGQVTTAGGGGGHAVYTTGAAITKAGTVVVGAAGNQSSLLYFDSSGSPISAIADAGGPKSTTALASDATHPNRTAANGGASSLTLNGVKTVQAGGTGSGISYSVTNSYGYGDGGGGGSSPAATGGTGDAYSFNKFGDVNLYTGAGADGYTSLISGKVISSGTGGNGSGQGYQYGSRTTYIGEQMSANGAGATGANSGCAGATSINFRDAGSGGFEMRYPNTQPQLKATTGTVSYTNTGGYHVYVWSSSGGYTI